MLPMHGRKTSLKMQVNNEKESPELIKIYYRSAGSAQSMRRPYENGTAGDVRGNANRLERPDADTALPKEKGL